MNTSSRFQLIVTGMHRSGLSWVASEINKNCAPQHISSNLFEDNDFLDLQRRAVISCCNPVGLGKPDWGWMDDEKFDQSALAQFFPEARRLLSQRRTNICWGWRDPRTTLLLDFWDALIPTACYVLVYRFPWDVSDSIQRLGLDIFLRQPEYAYRIWLFYNRHLLDFYSRHSGRCILLSANALSKATSQMTVLLESKLGITVGESNDGDTFKRELFQTIEGVDPLIDLLGAASPEVITMLQELDARADISSSSLWHADSPRTRLIHPDHLTDNSVKATVVIPSYNQGYLLLEAIASVERCAPINSELIIVDDGSADLRTLFVLQILRSSGYFVLTQTHAGHVVALNTAVALSHGDYILPFAHDNILCAGFIESAVDILNTELSVGVVYGNHRRFGLRPGVVDVPPFDLSKLLLRNYIDASAVYRKQVWIDCGGYDLAMLYEDWEFWIHAASRGWQFHKIEQITYNYRVRPNSLLAQSASQELLKRQMAYLIRKHSSLYLVNDRWIEYLSETWLRFDEHDGLIAKTNLAEQSLHVSNSQLDAIYRSRHWQMMAAYWAVSAQVRKIFNQFQLQLFIVWRSLFHRIG